jgi:dolichyl-phosphate beta-glucosyltransferase
VGRPHLSVVVPAYNEEARLGVTLERIGEYLDQKKLDAEILVIDDGSRDATHEVAEERLKGRRGRTLVNEENRGKGYSVRRGALAAEGRWILLTDADLSSPIEEHTKLADAARDRDLDIVIGSRAMAESQIEERQSLLRVYMGKTFNLLMRGITGLPFSDTQCGFKLMDRDRTRPLFERMCVDRFAFDVELLFLAVRFGLSVEEVPVVWRNDPQSRVSVITDPLQMFLDLLRIRWRFRRGAYNP